jgi:hypothetical protein
MELLASLVGAHDSGTIPACTCCTSLQEERYKKLKAAYLRAKRKQEQDRAEARATGKRRGIHGHKAAEGVKDKKRTRPLKKPVKPSLAVVCDVCDGVTEQWV